MSALASLSLKQRLTLSFGTIVVISSASLFVLWTQMTRLDAVNDDLQQNNLPQTALINALNDNLNARGISLRNLVAIPDDAARSKEVEVMRSLLAQTETVKKDLLQAFSADRSEASERKMIGDLLDKEGRLTALTGSYLPQVIAGQKAQVAPLIYSEFDPLEDAALQLADDATAVIAKSTIEQGQAAAAAYDRALVVLLLAAPLIVVGAVGMGWLTLRALSRVIGGEPADVQAMVRRVAAGDLSTSIVVRPGDTDSIVALMKAMQDRLGAIIASIRSGIDSVGTASAQIASGNQDLSSRTEQQASSLQETAASMEELTGTVRQSADSAQQANQLAVSASGAAARGGKVVSQVVSTMEDISSASHKIADIIGVIDGIAFQTNILALNAAVEAARAGEQGRGFAVVASEVRNLAQRSSQAAREIKTMIGSSVDKVEAGSRLVSDAGAAMGDIVQQVQRVTDLITEISAAAVEQSSGLGQINQAVAQMDQVTQQNSALVEESAAAAESLKHQAQVLGEAVAVFKLREGALADRFGARPPLALAASAR